MDPVRSMLFTPGNRLDMLGKAVHSGTDAVIVDLEDSVSLDNKPEARANLARLPESPVPYYVRTNAVETGLLWDDVVAAGTSPAVGCDHPQGRGPQGVEPGRRRPDRVGDDRRQGSGLDHCDPADRVGRWGPAHLRNGAGQRAGGSV